MAFLHFVHEISLPQDGVHGPAYFYRAWLEAGIGLLRLTGHETEQESHSY